MLDQDVTPLAKSEMRYRRLFETAQDGILILDLPTGQIQDVNPFLMNLLGYTRDEFVGKQLWEIGATVDKEASIAAFAQLKIDGYIRYDDLPLRKKGGKIISVEYVSNIYKVANDSVIQCNIRDISDRKEAVTRSQETHKQAEETRELLAALVESSADSIISTNLEGIISSWNMSAQRLFGYSAAEAIGQPISLILPPDLQKEEEHIVGEIRVGRNVSYFDTRRIRKDGSLVDITLTVSPIRDATGKVVGVSKSARDISERKQAEETRGLLVAIIESSTDAIISINLEGIISSWNKSAERMFGHTTAEAIGKHISLIQPPDLREEEEHILGEVRTGRSVAHYETRRIHKNGDLVDISMAVSPVRDATGKVIGASTSVRDVSERREAEKAREHLRQSQKMESLGQLTGGIAHDFNNLLAVILGNLDLMQERTEEGNPLRRFIDPGIEAALHGSELTQRLLAFSRKQTLLPKNVSINESISIFSTWLKRILGERIEVIMSLAPDLWIVHIDPGQLQDLLLNLSVNARDAMPNGGKLIFETKNDVLDADYAAQNPEVIPGDYAMLAVSDTGEGMTAEVIAKAFEPFFTTKEVGKGSGLGLSMVYGFVKQSAGHIKIYSEPGFGTSIKIYLPRAEGPPSSAKKPMEATVSSENKGKTVLVVEDNKNVLMITAEFVTDMGYKVITAETGDAALEIIKTRTDIDLLLTDVMLPGKLNGPVMAQQAVKILPSLKVLFVSGYAEHAIIQSGLLEEGVNLLSKPFRKKQLAEKMAELLQ